MIKINAVTLALNDEHTIAGTINCMKPFVNRHIVLISEKSYFGDVMDNGETAKVCDKLGVETITGFWKLDHFQRSLGNQMVSDCDWIMTLDSDEMIDSENMHKLINIMEAAPKDVYAIGVRPEVYFKNTDYVLRPIPDYVPIIATRPFVRFPYIRNIDHPFTIVDDVIMHHVSWGEPKDVYKKVVCYAHATDFDGKNWYNAHYKDVVPSDGLTVELPNSMYTLKYQPLPEELKKCLNTI
jgi:hypothetical protein